jgi:hypothetical protein
MNRRSFLTLGATATGATLALSNFPLPLHALGSNGRPKNATYGHNGFLYKLDEKWGSLDPEKVPVNDCHEMVEDRQGRILMLTNETRNNIVLYDKSGKFLGSWGNDFPGAHGLSIFREGAEEFLLITDTQLNEVYKTSLDGKILMKVDFRIIRESGHYDKKEEFKPTETAVAPSGDIYIADGYGKQLIHQFNNDGQYIRSFGGKGDEKDKLQTAHGVCVDLRNPKKPILLVTSRNHNAIKKFTLEGKYLDTIHLPGAFICRPVIRGKNLYGAVFRSKDNTLANSGFVVVLDEKDRVVSVPGGNEPVYKSNKLSPLFQQDPIFRHPHDVLVDADENIYVCQWASGKTYPVKLERVS